MTIPMMPSLPVGPVRRVSRNAWPTASKRHTSDHEIERQQRAEHLRRDDPGGEAGRRLELDQREAERDEDQRRDQEEGRQAGPPVEQLAESRDQRRQACRGEAATVGGPGVGPDPGGVRAGLQDLDSSVVWQRAGRLASESTRRPAPGMETPGDRSACHDRPASHPLTARVDPA